MNSVSMQSMPSGLLAKKGTARPAMRRQSQIQQGGGLGLSGWITGAEDDCGWNDMGDTAAPSEAPRSAIGLTPATHSPESLYVHSSGDDDSDWGEVEQDDWTPPPAASPQPDPAYAPANPVAALQERLQAAADPITAPAPAAVANEPVAPQPATVGLLGHVRAFFAHLWALIMGTGPILVVHPGYSIREKLLDRAVADGCSKEAVVQAAISRYLGVPDDGERPGGARSAPSAFSRSNPFD